MPNGGHLAHTNKTPRWVRAKLKHMQLDVGQEVTLLGRHFVYQVRVISEQQGHINQVYDIQRYARHPSHTHHHHYFNRRYSITVLIVVIIIALIIGIWLGSRR